jgi:hypothetical protein
LTGIETLVIDLPGPNDPRRANVLSYDLDAELLEQLVLKQR